VAIALLRIHCFESFESTICFLGVETYDNDNDTRDSRICVLYQRKSAFFFSIFRKRNRFFTTVSRAEKSCPIIDYFKKALPSQATNGPGVPLANTRSPSGG